MTEDQNQNSHQAGRAPISGNVVALILIVNFVIIAGLIAVLTAPQTPAADPEISSVAMSTDATVTPLPTSTVAEPTALPTASQTSIPVTPETELASSTTGSTMDVSAGETTFSRFCSACHGFAAQGVPGLGPSMIDNSFVNALSDEELLEFLVVGRAVTHPDNSSGVAMPARGGNPSLTDADLMNVVAFIRSLNAEPGSVVEVAEPVAREPRVAREFTPLSLTGLGPEREGDDVTRSEPDPFFSSNATAYNATCAGCHGIDGEGLPLITAPLSESALLLSQNGIALYEFLTQAQPPMDPRTGFQHPYRGGNPEISDEEALNIIGYLYSLVEAGENNTP